MSVTLIIPTRNQHHVLDQAIRSIANSHLDNVGDVDIVIVDNQSDEPQSLHYLHTLPENPITHRFKKISVIPFNKPFNYSAMNNAAVHHAQGDVLCFLNNDIEVISEDWLTQLSKSALEPQHGCTGLLMFYPNDTVQHAGVVLGMGSIAGHAYVGLTREETRTHPYFEKPRYCTAVTGACLAVRRNVFEQVGGFEEQLAVAFNDIDFCLKVKKLGLSNRFLPGVHLYHHESLSRGKGIKTQADKQRHKSDIAYLTKRWGAQVLEDSFWSTGHKEDGLASMAQNQPKNHLFWRRKTKRYLHIDLL